MAQVVGKIVRRGETYIDVDESWCAGDAAYALVQWLKIPTPPGTSEEEALLAEVAEQLKEHGGVDLSNTYAVVDDDLFSLDRLATILGCHDEIDSLVVGRVEP
jgi:hypothetical protein